MITVKGAKAETQSTDPAAPYARKPDEKPGTAAKVGLLLAAVFLYLKAFLPSRTAASEDPPVEELKEEAATAPKVLAMPSGTRQKEPGFTDPDESVVVTSSLGVPFGFGPGADLITFAISERQVVSPLFQPAVYVARQANDNAAPGWGRAGYTSPPDAPAVVAGAGTGNSGETTVEDQPTARDALPVVQPESDGPGGGSSPGGDPEDEEDEDGAPDPVGNRAPRVIGPVQLNDIASCVVLAIGLADFLRGAIDPDGDTLSISDVTTSSGDLSKVDTGLWEFTPEGELGPVTITYRVSDGDLEVTQSLHFAVVPMEAIGGSERDDILIGTLCADGIDAGAGDDLVDGLAGNDFIRGGTGDDHVLAGTGADVVQGGPGHDLIFGGSGDDEIRGGAGNDRLFGGSGDDTLWGGAGDDTIHGGIGDDLTSGGAGNDRLLGEAGDDTLFGDDGDDVIQGGTGDDLVVAGPGSDSADGGAGDDRLLGGSGNDHLSGGVGRDILLGEAGHDILDDGAGEDVVLGGEGDDQVLAAADRADDRYDGGEGCDLLDYTNARERIEIDLVDGRASGVEIGRDTISGFERIATGAGDDLIRIGGRPISISGGEGCNTFDFTAASGNALTSPPEQLRQTRYDIEDFKVGDRLRMSKWEILDEVFDEFEDRFERLYGDRMDDDDVPIRYQNDRTDDLNETIIGADLDGDEFYETAIVLNGRHALVFFENA